MLSILNKLVTILMASHILNILLLQANPLYKYYNYSYSQKGNHSLDNLIEFVQGHKTKSRDHFVDDHSTLSHKNIDNHNLDKKISIDGQLGYFHILAIVNNATINIGVWCIYMMEYYLAMRKKEILPFGTQIDLEDIMLSET